MEFAVNNGENQKNKDGNDSNSNHPIRSHPNKVSATCNYSNNRIDQGRGERGVSTYEPYPSKS
jgi:hypothetical protein